MNSPAFGVNLDPEPHVSLSVTSRTCRSTAWGRKLFHLHVSDNDGVTNVHWRPGMGKIDWRLMLQALKDIGYTGVISIELEERARHVARANFDGTRRVPQPNRD